MELQLIKHDDILFRDILRAVSVKSIAWPHPIESQLKWIIDNMHPNDIHVFLTDGKADRAYMTLSPVEALVDGNPISFLGVGCVCTRDHGRGAGKELMTRINQFLLDENHKGLLFCRQELIQFYKKFNWNLIPIEKVRFISPHEGVYTMTFNCEGTVWFDYSGRFF